MAMMRRTPIEALIDDAADLHCSICKTPVNVGCECWEACSCGWHALAGQPCNNPETRRCSTKVKYGDPKDWR